MTVFGLAISVRHASFTDLFRNLAWTVPGNIAGGGLLVAYNFSAGRSRATAETGEMSAPVPVGNGHRLAQATATADR